MANLLSLSLTFLIFFHGCLALQPFQKQQNWCQIQKMNVLEPFEVIEAEGGHTEFFDSRDHQFRCAGVEVIRHRIQPQGLLLPSYVNTPLIVYILQGRGYQGIMLPGCPETFQSSQQMQEGGLVQDRHQKIRQFEQGDVIVIPTGAPHWMYNDGQEELVALVMLDLTNSANQLDQFNRRFFLAGNPNGEKTSEDGSDNIFRGFNPEILSEVFNIDQEITKNLQSLDDTRGHIVIVEKGLKVIRPVSSFEQQERQKGGGQNGFEETICSAKYTSNIIDVDMYRADRYNPQPGWSTILDSSKLPILKRVKLSAQRGVLKKNVFLSPYWYMNAHNVIHVTQGNMRMQIVNNEGQRVFDDVINEGEMVVVPQTFAAFQKAGEKGCEWISFRTNDNVMKGTAGGHTSFIKAMPMDVLVNAYQLSIDEVMSLKNYIQD